MAEPVAFPNVFFKSTNILFSLMGHFCPYKAEKKFQNSGLQFLLYLSVQYNSHINAFAFIPCGWSGGHL